MTRRHPSRLAVALLERFLPGNEPLTGDLLEASQRHSNAWLWRQVILAILIRTVSEIQAQKRLSAEAALVSAAMLTLLGFHAVVVASLANHLLVLNDASWIPVTGRYERWQLASMMPFFLAAIASGRGIGHFHRDHRVLAIVSFGASAALAAFLNLYLFVPNVLLEPFVPYAALQTAVVMVFIAGLFVGIGSSPVRHSRNTSPSSSPLEA